ncbi:MAG TPA: sterol desaturase family protein [Polyangiales bacterium]|nr:sterol desaturase family protein [Polyangiales bacterium]
MHQAPSLWAFYSHRLHGMWLATAIGVAVFAVLVLIGYAIDRRKLWRWGTSASGRHLRTDLGFLLLAPLNDTIARSLTTFAVAACAALLGIAVGPHLVDGFGPISRQPMWLIMLEMLVLGDLGFYWSHRLAHTVPWLWRIHAVHHSTRVMRWSSAIRVHPAEGWAHLLNAVPLFLLGFPIDHLLPVIPLMTAWAWFIHADLDVDLGPLRCILNNPAHHRWHHALDVTNGTKNYAGLFPVFDLVFGSYRRPDQPPDALGIDDNSMPETTLAQVLYPLRVGDAHRPP